MNESLLGRLVGGGVGWGVPLERRGVERLALPRERQTEEGLLSRRGGRGSENLGIERRHGRGLAEDGGLVALHAGRLGLLIANQGGGGDDAGGELGGTS